MRLFTPNAPRNHAEDKGASPEIKLVTVSLERLDIYWDLSFKYHVFLSDIYRIEIEHTKLGDRKTVDHLWAAIEAFVDAYEKMSPDSRPLPGYLAALRAEISGLRNGVPSPLFSRKSVRVGDNHQSPIRLLWRAQAAGFLRLFMKRDGRGVQKTAAARIAKALEAGGVLAPGARKESYTGRSVIEWLRQAQQGKTPLAKD